MSSKSSLRINGQYKVVKKIGAGSFGEVFLGKDKNSGRDVAIKMEESDQRHPQLPDEWKLYKHLEGGVGIPKARWFGTEKRYNCLVMDLLGPSLQDLFDYCNHRFSMKTVIMLAVQMIDRCEYLHSKCFIHRDLKPENMLMGTGEYIDEVFLIDFGLAKKYYDTSRDKHIKYSEDRGMCGTARFTSINSHKGREQSRRDDMEGIGYILMYFNLEGKLPWQKLRSSNKRQKYDNICQSKMDTEPESLCKHFPAEFAAYMRYCRGLEFEEKPDYQYLRELFKKLFRTLKYHRDRDMEFDWTVKADRH